VWIQSRLSLTHSPPIPKRSANVSALSFISASKSRPYLRRLSTRRIKPACLGVGLHCPSQLPASTWRPTSWASRKLLRRSRPWQVSATEPSATLISSSTPSGNCSSNPHGSLMARVISKPCLPLECGSRHH